jgi:ribonuclease HI
MNDEILEAFGEYWGETTNNQAEYRAIQLALEAIAKYQPKVVHGFMDSELAVRQLNGIYKVKNIDIKPIHAKILTLAAQYKTTFKHVYREQNKLADAQVNISIDRALGIRTD